MSAEMQNVFVSTPHHRQVRHVAKMLENGAVVICPTDTVYGLTADVRNKKAVERLFKIKDISKHKPLSLIFPDLNQIGQYSDLDNRVFRIMKRVLPGPYTFILPISNHFPKTLSQKRETIGVRVPNCEICRALTEELGGPLLTTSLPPISGAYIFDANEILRLYGQQVDLILAGDKVNNFLSTVIDFSVNPPQLLRQGAGDVSQIL